jgi:ABC-type multidrug transport system ATPase subunit
LGLQKDPVAFDPTYKKNMPASQVPPVSLSYFDLEIEGITNKLSGHIIPGELVAVLGKKTLRDHMLRTLSGVHESPDKGQILLQGIEHCKIERQNHISFIDNDYVLCDHQTVNRSLTFATKMNGNQPNLAKI